MIKEYLGDGVYVDADERGIVLTTENGIRATNTIVLEPEVVGALERFIAKVRRAVAAQNAGREGT